jgi:hypothetical protein
VKEREGISIAAQKKGILSNITHGLRLASERVIDVMPTASTKDALIGVGILTEKMQLLSGEVTSRVEHVEKIDMSQEAWEAEILSKLPAADVREIEAPGIHLEAGKFPTKKLTNGSSENGAQNGPEPAGEGAVMVLKEAAA